jgi:hypothetical protein
MSLRAVRTTLCLIGCKALPLETRARIPNPMIVIIQVDVSGTVDATGGGAEIDGDTETGPG